MTNTNDVMGVVKPTTHIHNNIDDLSFFDFKVEKRPLFFDSVDAFNTSVMREIKGKHAVVRADTHQCLGVHGRTYKIVPHIDVYKRHAESIKNSSAYDPE